MNKVDIVVGTPSFNEESTIGYVTQKIDEGLTKYFHNYKSLIINVDESTDDTRKNFLKTKTVTPKISFYVGPPPGKGRNIFKLLEYASEVGAEYVCTIDSDIKSIQKNWIKKLLSPLINKEANYVTPLYMRNRYEGNTTNHFCVPLLSGYFNSKIRQPIGGEFAMNNKVVEYVLSQKRNPEARKYGIDIFITMNAIGHGFKTEEVYLGKKIHKSSFEKMVPMFKQVAATAFYVMGQYKNRNFLKRRHKLSESSKRRIGIDTYAKMPSQEAIHKRKKYAIEQLKLLLKRSDEFLIPLDRGLIKNTVRRPQIGKELWVEILYEFVRHILNNEIIPSEATRLSHIISPFYLLRVLTYYKEIENLSPKEIEHIISFQKDLLKHKLRFEIKN